MAKTLQSLAQAQIDKQLATHPEWTQMGDAIQRTYDFDDFIHAMAFVQKIAEQAEQAQHHPDILIRYNKVTLTLSTHDAKGITKKDFDAAAFADGEYGGG